jgi:hypothetical protein
MIRLMSRMPAVACVLVACLIMPAMSRAGSSFVRVGPPADVAAVAALARSHPDTASVGDVVVIGNTGYVEYGTRYVWGLQIFAKKIGGTWKMVAGEGDDVATAAELSAKSHGQLTPAQICALYHRVPELVGPHNTKTTRDKTTPGCQ